MHCQPQHGWVGWGDWDGACNLWNQSNLMVSWWGMKPRQANTRHSKLLFWKCCRGRSPDRYFTQARKPRAWGLPRASAPWSLSFPREGLVSAMLVGFGHLRAKILPCWTQPECSSCLLPQNREAVSSPKASSQVLHHTGKNIVIATSYRGHSHGWCCPWDQYRGSTLENSSKQVKSSGETTAMECCWLPKGNMDGIGYLLDQLKQLTLEMDTSTPVLCQGKDFLG